MLDLGVILFKEVSPRSEKTNPTQGKLSHVRELTLGLRVPTLGLFFVRELTLGLRVPTLCLFFLREPTLGLRVLTLGLLIFVS